jgi:hypothetical protein
MLVRAHTAHTQGKARAAACSGWPSRLMVKLALPVMGASWSSASDPTLPNMTPVPGIDANKEDQKSKRTTCISVCTHLLSSSQQSYLLIVFSRIAPSD